MFKFTCILIALAIAPISAQTPVSQNCMGNDAISAYNLTPSAKTVYNNGTCSNFFSTNGACATPFSVIREMNFHNAWLAYKALDAQRLGIHYVNATIYWQNKTNIWNDKTPYTESATWYGDFLDTADNFWEKIKNRQTALFKVGSQWYKSVFLNHMYSIPSCLQAWGNITNGAYCLLASAHNFPNRTISTNQNNKPSVQFGVNRVSTGFKLSNCVMMIDTYCQMSYGLSLFNVTQPYPFNTTLNWTDGGLSLDQCTNLRNQIICGSDSTCIQNLYEALINIFESHWIRFIPGKAALDDLGQKLVQNRDNATISMLPAASSGNSFKIYSDPAGLDLSILGYNSGQRNRTYVVGSAERFMTALSLLLVVKWLI